jgi:hypothetical protein
MIAVLVPSPSIDRRFLGAGELQVGAIHRPTDVVATAGGARLASPSG